MKFLENEKLTDLTAELSDAELGQSHRVINGRIEAYTMKRAGSDKKVAHELGQKYIAEMEEIEQDLADTLERRKRSASATSFLEAVSKKAKTTKTRVRSQSFEIMLNSPKTTLGDFTELGTRRLMTDLILTLNASFPDYDFANVKPTQFEKLSLEAVRERIYGNLSELASFKDRKNWLVELWMALNEVIHLHECDIFSFDDELEEGALWNFHYFFVNKSLRRIVFFTCSERIDETGHREEASDEAEYVNFVNTEARLVDDFDWDPSDNIAGGMPLPISS